MNVVVMAVTVWLVLAWIGLVFLIAKTGRNRRPNHPRPPSSTGHGVTAVPVTGAPPADIRGKLPYYWAGLGGGATGDWNQDENREEWGGGDWGDGSFGGGDSGGGGD